MTKSFKTKDNRVLLLRRLERSDFSALSNYLFSLSAESKKRFGPHAYDPESIARLYSTPGSKVTGFLAISEDTSTIAGYAVLQEGWLAEEVPRFEAYGIRTNQVKEASFAPSVADEWQNAGIGVALFQEVVSYCKQSAIKRLFLWGGVQADNSKALHFYSRNGFLEIGRFEYNGPNIDMMLWIR